MRRHPKPSSKMYLDTRTVNTATSFCTEDDVLSRPISSSKLAWTILGCCLIPFTNSWAQSLPRQLGQVPGATELQSNTGTAVQETCIGLNAIDNDPERSLTELQLDLRARCRELVQTAPNTPDSYNLGLEDPELNAALQQVATEEAAAAGSLATEISSANAATVISRLAAVRRGVSGFGLSGLNVQDRNGQRVAMTDFKTGQSGGGAGDDTNSLLGGKLGVFINGNIGTGEKDATEREDGFDFDIWAITIGADYRLTDNIVLGGAFTFNDLDTDFDTTPTVSGGDVEADGWNLTFYGTHYGDSYYVDGLVGFGQSDYDLSRRILYQPGPNPGPEVINDPLGLNPRDRTAKADTDSDEFAISVGGGYSLSGGAFSYGPFVRLDYVTLDIDGYEEKGAQGLNLKVEDQDIDSFQSVLGGEVSYALSTDFGVLVPQGRLGWVHEFADDDRRIKATYVNDPNQFQLVAETDAPDRDYGTLLLGLSGVFQGGAQAFLAYETVLGLRDVEEHLFTIGGRIDF